jgi:hypothetical protein
MKIGDYEFPQCPAEAMDMVRKHSGSTMSELHALGYRSIFTPLSELIRWEAIFEFENRYYPND